MLYCLKEQSIKNSFIGKFPYISPTKYSFKIGANKSGAMRHSTGSNFTGEYLGEFETEFENILGC
jgi:hypothetical protein